MRAIDLDQALAACRDAADLMAAAAAHPNADLSPAERRELFAIALGILALIKAPVPDAQTVARPMEVTS